MGERIGLITAVMLGGSGNKKAIEKELRRLDRESR